MKGLNFNVTLSKEQIDEIADVTADKVLLTKQNRYDTEEWNRSEIKSLKAQISHRDKMIVEREVTIERLKTLANKIREELKLYKEKYGDIN